MTERSNDDTTCAFCRIIAGSAPASMLTQDDLTLAFLDLYPVNPGHALVVPKGHFDDLTACPPPVAGRLMMVAKRLAGALVETTRADGFNVWVANGHAAGQEVFHVHLHVLPRFRGDKFGLRFPKGYPTEAGRTVLDDLAKKVRDRL